MNRIRASLVAIALVLAVAPRAPAAPSLAHLRGIAELKSWFSAQKGHPRLIFLLSPT